MDNQPISSIQFLDTLAIYECRLQNRHRSDLSGEFPNDCFGFILKGQGCFAAERESISVGENDLIFIPKGTRYISTWRGDPEITFYSLQYHFFNRQKNFTFQKLENVPELRALFDRIYRAYQSKGQEALCVSAFYSLIYHMEQALEMQEPSRDIPVARALEYIQKNACAEFRVSALARMCNITVKG